MKTIKLYNTNAFYIVSYVIGANVEAVNADADDNMDYGNTIIIIVNLLCFSYQMLFLIFVNKSICFIQG